MTVTEITSRYFTSTRYRLPSSPRTVIQMNRSATMFLLYLLFLTCLDPNVLGLDPEKFLCRSVAIAIHFLALCTFSWTAIEGHQLYRALVRRQLSDADGRYSNLVRYLVGYGTPLVVVSITLIFAYGFLDQDAYGHTSADGQVRKSERTCTPVC